MKKQAQMGITNCPKSYLIVNGGVRFQTLEGFLTPSPGKKTQHSMRKLSMKFNFELPVRAK